MVGIKTNTRKLSETGEYPPKNGNNFMGEGEEMPNRGRGGEAFILVETGGPLGDLDKWQWYGWLIIPTIGYRKSFTRKAAML
jgi:hypothetical protein